MSKQIGLIKVKGNLDGVSFYQSQGENFVRMAKGPDKKRILTDPAFQRTRENNREFAGCAKAGKALRSALAPVMFIADRQFNARMLRLFKAVNTRSAGVRGQRPIAISGQRALLENLELNQKQSLAGVFNTPINASHTPERTSASIQIPEFNPAETVVATPGATHFRLVQVIGVLSDYTFNTSTNKFESVVPALDTLNNVVYSDYLPLQSEQKLSINLVTPLPATDALPANVSVVQGLGMVYYQQIGNIFYQLSQANALKIVAVF